MRATWNGAVLANSDNTVVVEGNHYFPADSVAWDMLTATDTRTTCSWKGVAPYWTVTVDGSSNPDAVWAYPDPRFQAAHIKDRVAFWKGDTVG